MVTEQPATPRGGLSRDLIVSTATRLIEHEGRLALTMRRLGAELGVEAMSLYRYVSGREELLDAVVEQLVAELDADPVVLSSPEQGWQDFLQRLAHGMRRIAMEHPRAFPLVASRPTAAPWIRPPLRSLLWVERFAAALSASGFSDTGVATAYRAYTSMLLGHLLLEASVRGAETGPLDEIATQRDSEPSDAQQQDALARYDHVRRLRPMLEQDRSKEEFEVALEELLNRLELAR